MAKLVCIKMYISKSIAEVARGILSTNDIEAVISGSDPAQPEIEFVTGVKLLVHEKDK